MIPSLSIFGMACSALLAIGFPVVLLVFWHKKTHASYAAAGVGALMFLVFAMVLEQLLHTVVLRPDGFVANTHGLMCCTARSRRVFLRKPGALSASGF